MMRGLRSKALFNIRAGVLVGLALALTPGQALRAAPLTLDNCLALWRNNTSPTAVKVEQLMAEGAAGARQRLTEDQLAQIKKHIEALEQLKFRCRQFVPPPPGASAP